MFRFVNALHAKRLHIRSRPTKFTTVYVQYYIQGNRIEDQFCYDFKYGKWHEDNLVRLETSVLRGNGTPAPSVAAETCVYRIASLVKVDPKQRFLILFAPDEARPTRESNNRPQTHRILQPHGIPYLNDSRVAYRQRKQPRLPLMLHITRAIDVFNLSS